MFVCVSVARKMTPNPGIASYVVTISTAAHIYAFHSSALKQLLTFARLITEVKNRNGRP